MISHCRRIGPALMITAVTAAGCSVAPVQENEAASTVRICEVLENPIAFDRSLIRISGLVVRDFETFWIQGSGCPKAQPLWIEYGGPKPADGPIWHDPPTGEGGPLVVGGITTYLETNVVFRRFDATTKALKRGRRARATLVGRVFATGVYIDDDGEEQEIGFGPYGMYSLFVVQKVESVSQP